MDPPEDVVKPKGPFDKADLWIQEDKEWQLAVFKKTKKRPRLDDPTLKMFGGNAEVHAAAIAGRLLLCAKPEHLEPNEWNEALRFNTMQEVYKNKTCKKCTCAVEKAKKEAVRPPAPMYEKAEDFMEVNAPNKCGKFKEMTVGYCPRPVREQFRNNLEFDRALHMRDMHNQTYRHQLHQNESVKERNNETARERYAADKETEEGRMKIHDKMMHDQENKMARKKKVLEEGMDYCEFGSHAVDRSEMIFCPAVDLGITDFKGKLGRVRRGACKAHYQRVLQKWNAFRYKYRSDITLRIRFRLEWWRSDAKKRGKTISLTQDEQMALITSPCAYCRVHASPEIPNGIDMKDGLCTDYASNTCVSCCKSCNMAKNGMLGDAYVKKCNDIALFQTFGIAATEFIPYRQVYHNGLNAIAKVYYNTGSYDKYKYDAVRRGYAFSLTKEEFVQKKRNGCVYCGILSPLHIGIDRIDNTGDYTYANTCGSCTTCNMMKWTVTKTDFLNTCARVAAHAMSVNA